MHSLPGAEIHKQCQKKQYHENDMVVSSPNLKKNIGLVATFFDFRKLKCMHTFKLLVMERIAAKRSKLSTSEHISLRETREHAKSGE